MKLSPGLSKECVGVDVIDAEYLADVRNLHLFRSKPNRRLLSDDSAVHNSSIRNDPGISLLEKNLRVLCIIGTGDIISDFRELDLNLRIGVKEKGR